MDNNKGWIISTIILSLLVIGLSVYVVYDKVFKNDEVIENKIEDNNKENENENDISWVDYLLEQQFVSASLNVCKVDGNYVYNKDVDMQPNPGASRDISRDELKSLLTTIYNSDNQNDYGEIVKGYEYYIMPACRDDIVYKYIHDNKEYEFLLAGSSIIETEDEELLKILNNSVNNNTSYIINKVNTDYYNLVKDMMKDYIK